MSRTMTIEKTVFKFEELDESAQERALDYFRESACDDSHWYEFVYDDAARIFDILGIHSVKHVPLMNGKTRQEPAIWFSGFCSQGDGACFGGSYSYKAGASKAIREYAPKDETLHRIADDLTRVQRRNFYALQTSIKHRGHYYHSGCTEIETEDSRRPYDTDSESAESIKDSLRELMDWIYKQLETEYNYQTSDECLIENIQANEYEFDESGRLA